MSRFHKLLAAVSAIPLLFSLLIGSVLLVALTPAVYSYEADILRQHAEIGCERATLDNITGVLVGYMRGEVANLDMDAFIGGEMREVFSQRDKDHMVDVKNLFDIGRYAVVIGLVAWLVLWTAALLLGKPAARGKTVAEGMLMGTLIFFGIMAALAAYIAIGFERAFTQFHLIFFSNDLWLLPSDSVLLQMMPTQFFIHMAMYIGILFAVGVLLVVGISILARGLAIRAMKRAELEPESEGNSDAVEKSRRLAAVMREVNAASKNEPVTAVPAPDGNRFVLRTDDDAERPEAEEIFEQFGLSDADDQPLMPDEAHTVTGDVFDEPNWGEETPLGEPEPYIAPSPPKREPEVVVLPDSSGLAALYKANRDAPVDPPSEQPGDDAMLSAGGNIGASGIAREEDDGSAGVSYADVANVDAELPPADSGTAPADVDRLPPFVMEGRHSAGERADAATPAVPDAPREAAIAQELPRFTFAADTVSSGDARIVPPAENAESSERLSTEPSVISVAPVATRPGSANPGETTLRVPVRLPVSAISGDKLAKGVKLEFTVELVGDEDALSASDAPPSMDEIMQRLDRIIADLPGEEK